MNFHIVYIYKLESSAHTLMYFKDIDCKCKRSKQDILTDMVFFCLCLVKYTISRYHPSPIAENLTA